MSRNFVSGVLIDDLPMQCAFAGDSVVLTVTGIDMSNVTVGKSILITTVDACVYYNIS